MAAPAHQVAETISFPESQPGNDPAQGWAPRLWWVAVVINLGALAYPILHFRGLFADGAPHLLQLLSTRAPYQDLPRTAAIRMMEGPTLLLVAAHGVSTIRSAAWVYSASLLLTPWILVVAGVAFLPSQRRVLAWFTVLSMLLAYFLGSVFSVSEVFVATALWWGVLFFIIGDDFNHRSWLAIGGAFVAMSLLAFSYEPVSMLAAFLLVLLLLRHAPPLVRAGRWTRLAPLIAMALVLFVALVVGADWTLFPETDYRRGALAQGIRLRALLRSNGLRLYAATLIVALLTLRTPTWWTALRRQRTRWMAWTAAAVLFVLVAARRGVVTPLLQFDGRLLVPVGVVSLSAAALVVLVGMERGRWKAGDIARWLAPMVVCLSVLHVWWQFETTRGWQDYTTAVQQARQPGRVVEAPQLDANPYRWRWAVASLSILLTGMEHSTIDGIVFMKADAFVFDPQCPSRWPSLEEFGVRYKTEPGKCP